jgi:hypothetical protein
MWYHRIRLYAVAIWPSLFNVGYESFQKCACFCCTDQTNKLSQSRDINNCLVFKRMSYPLHKKGKMQQLLIICSFSGGSLFVSCKAISFVHSTITSWTCGNHGYQLRKKSKVFIAVEYRLLGYQLLVFCATFSYILATVWRLVLLVEDNGIATENNLP